MPSPPWLYAVFRTRVSVRRALLTADVGRSHLSKPAPTPPTTNDGYAGICPPIPAVSFIGTLRFQSIATPYTASKDPNVDTAPENTRRQS